MKSEPGPRAERLAGIEWMRAIAAFGVICIHSGIAVHNRTTPATGMVREGFGFAIPFFLVASFFFAVRAEKERWVPWGAWLRRYAERLFLPFVFWSTVYLALHVAKLVAHHQNDQIAGLFTDPVALFFSGGTSLALYFLPLLFAGLALIHLLSPVFRQSSFYLVVGFIAALALHAFCYRHGFDYDLNSTRSAPALFRLLFGLIEEAIRCSPLVFAAALLTRWLPSPKIQNTLPLFAAGAVFLIAIYFISLSADLIEPVLGVSAFLLAWALSGLLKPTRIATVVGSFSFGVYLIHQIFLEAIQTVYFPAQPVGVIGILLITLAVYLASMLVVGLAARGGASLRKIFGLKCISTGELSQ